MAPPPASRLWLAAVIALIASYLLITWSHYTLGALSIDDAASYLVAASPLRVVLTLPVLSQGQPPLFFLALHAWLRFGDSEAVMRALPLVFMLCAALTLLATTWLTPATRFGALAVLLLGRYSVYLTPTLRPYALAAWLSLWSCLELGALLREPRRSVWAYGRSTAVTLLLAYSLTLAVWTLLAQGLCAIGALAIDARRRGVPPTLRRYRALFLSLTIIAVSYLPHAVPFIRYQAVLERPPLAVTLAAVFNPRYYVSGPLYFLAMPAGLGILTAIAALAGVRRGARERDPLVALLVTVIVLQIGLTHGAVAGRYGFSFRYITPAFPALCLLTGLGLDWLVSRWRRADAVFAAAAACALASAVVVYAKAPRASTVGRWRQVAGSLRSLPGKKIVFFDVGWDAQSLRYEARHDPGVEIRNFDGPGWGTYGRKLTADYVTEVIDREAVSPALVFYQLDAALGSRVFDEAFRPGMARHHCASAMRLIVPTLARDDPGGVGGLLDGYRCPGG